MVVLRRVESRDRVFESTHQENLKTILRFFSSNPNNPNAWREEWSVNPLYMVDLGRYGAGNCMCGHAIRYQFQFINSVNHKTLPVGSVCVKQLDLPKYSEVLDKLERLLQMSESDIDMSARSLDPMEFIKKYKKYFSPDNIKALADYDKIPLDTDFYFYKDFYRKRKYPSHVAARAKDYIIKIYDIVKPFVTSIKRSSSPVSQGDIATLDQEFEERAKKAANAKQLSFNF